MPYEIIATLGPSSASPVTWQAMLSAGATAFRLNTSHLSLDQLQAWLEKLDAYLSTQNTRPPLVLDLQGSKWRLGQFSPFDLAAGQTIDLIYAASTRQSNQLPVPHTDFFRAAAVSSGKIVLNDAKIQLEMESFGAEWVKARIIQGGGIAPNKGITFTHSEYRSETLTEKDQAILNQTQGIKKIRYAISYVKDAAEMRGYRGLIHEQPGSQAYIIAKLERGPAMVEAGDIGAAADELWVCRGDLGAELGLVEMAKAVQRFSAEAAQSPIPVIMAGQVLEHMTGQPVPTRSEVCYLNDALSKGYRGFVLSDETAIGRYPVESCQIAALFKTPAPD